MKEYLDFAVNIALYAGTIMEEYFNKDKSVEFKEDRTPVTIADKIINNYLIEKVKEKYPKHKVIGEEAIFDNKSRCAWVCDPIDGTSAFMRGIPISVFSLAYVEDGVPLVGVVYNPFQDEMYTAIKGHGAYLNGQRLHVNKKKYGELGSVIDYCMWHNAKYDTLKIVSEIRENNKTSSMGSVAHACMLVANGSISGVIFPGSSHGECDIAASKLIVEEAGGKTCNFKGSNQRYDKDIDGFVATNKVIHKELIDKIKEVYK